MLITAAAGAGIGFAAAKKVVEEGCRALVISDIHEGRLEKAVANDSSESDSLRRRWLHEPRSLGRWLGVPSVQDAGSSQHSIKTERRGVYRRVR